MNEELTPDEKRKEKQRAHYHAHYSKPDNYSGRAIRQEPDENYAAELEGRFHVHLPIRVVQRLRGVV